MAHPLLLTQRPAPSHVGALEPPPDHLPPAEQEAWRLGWQKGSLYTERKLPTYTGFGLLVGGLIGGFVGISVGSIAGGVVGGAVKKLFK